MLCTTANPPGNDDVHITKAKYYLDHDTAALWASVQIPAHTTWLQFKPLIYALYPGADDNNRYTLTDLEHLAHEHAMQGIFTRGELGEYHRKWITISSWLAAHAIGDARTLNRTFMSGLSPALHEKVEQRLLIT